MYSDTIRDLKLNCLFETIVYKINFQLLDCKVENVNLKQMLVEFCGYGLNFQNKNKRG